MSSSFDSFQSSVSPAPPFLECVYRCWRWFCCNAAVLSSLGASSARCSALGAQCSTDGQSFMDCPWIKMLHNELRTGYMSAFFLKWSVSRSLSREGTLSPAEVEHRCLCDRYHQVTKILRHWSRSIRGDHFSLFV